VPAKVGLGSSIVEALARQLKATVHLADANPGVSVSIVHDGALAGGGVPESRAV